MEYEIYAYAKECLATWFPALRVAARTQLDS